MTSTVLVRGLLVGSLLSGLARPLAVTGAQDDPPFFGHRVVNHPYRNDRHRLRIECRGLEKEYCDQLAERIQYCRQWLGDPATDESMGFGLKDWPSLDLRIRPVEGHAWHVYTGGLAAITIMLPENDVLFGDRPVDGGSALLDAMAETTWARMLKPMWWMPSSVRAALSRFYARRLHDRLIQQYGREAALPAGLEFDPEAFGRLPADHPVVEGRDLLLGLLDEFEVSEGTDRLAARIELWGARSWSGDRAYEDLLAVLAGAEDPDAAWLDGIEDVLPQVEFATREPWVGPHIGLLKGMRSELNQTGRVVDQSYGLQRGRPNEFLSLRELGGVGMLLRVPHDGRAIVRLSDVRAFLRRVGESTDEWFYVLLLDERGRELFRWPYPLAQVPASEDGTWLDLSNTVNPQCPEYCFVALELPPSSAADLQLGMYARPAADHSFEIHSGRSVRSLESTGDLALQARTKLLSAGGRSLLDQLRKLTTHDRESSSEQEEEAPERRGD